MRFMTSCQYIQTEFKLTSYQLSFVGRRLQRMEYRNLQSRKLSVEQHMEFFCF